MVTDLILHY